MNNISTHHTQSSFFFSLFCISIFLSAVVAGRFPSECLITRQILPQIALTTLGNTNTTDTYSLNYEIAKGFYSGCYDIQVSFVTTEGTFKSTNYLERRDNTLKPYSEVFKFSVVIPQHKIRDVCIEQYDLNSDEVRCKIILKLIEKPTSIVTGYFEDNIIVKTQYPNDSSIKRSSSIWSLFPFRNVRFIKFTPLVNNEGIAEHVFAYEMKDKLKNNEESLRNSRSSAVQDENASNTDDQVQVNDYQVDENMIFQAYIDYQLETFNTASYSSLSNSTEYSKDDTQLHQFKVNSSLRLQFLNYPSTEIFSLRLGKTTTFLEIPNQSDQAQNSSNHSKKKDKDRNIDLKDQSLILIKQDDNDPFLLTFQNQKGASNSSILPSFSIIQEIVFISKPTVLKQIIISQYFQLNYSDNILQVIYLPSISHTLTQSQASSASTFDSIINKNTAIVIILGIIIIFVLMLVLYLRIIRIRFNIVGALKQTFSASNVAELDIIEIKQ